MATQNGKPEIQYTTASCSLGRILVAGTSKGVCGIYLGDTDKSLVNELEEDHRSVKLTRDKVRLKSWLDAALECLQGETPALEPPLDVAGTEFQWRVWRELRSIPLGHTRSYKNIAKALGQPNASRAVGGACATNRVSLIIPCHRAIREDGGLGGYRWGIKRKKLLLKCEREAASLQIA